MTGGAAYVWDPENRFASEQRLHQEFVETERLGKCACNEQALVHDLLHRHALKTGSRLGQELVGNWPEAMTKMLRVAPKLARG